MRYTKTWTISLPPAMEREVLQVAKEERRTKSELVREALRAYIVSQRWRSLQRTAAAHARAKGVRTEADVERMVDEFRSGV